MSQAASFTVEIVQRVGGFVTRTKEVLDANGNVQRWEYQDLPEWSVGDFIAGDARQVASFADAKDALVKLLKKHKANPDVAVKWSVATSLMLNESLGWQTAERALFEIKHIRQPR